MKRSDYLIVILLLVTWLMGDLYHFFPRDYRIDYFTFSESTVTIRRYIYDVSIYAQFIIFAVCILIRKIDLHKLTKDVIKITIGLIVFSGVWYSLFYGNPFYKAELWMKFVAIGIIYIAVKSINWHAKRNDRIYNR